MDFPPTSLTAHPFRSELTARAYHQDLGGRGGSTSRILVRDGSIGVTVFKYKCSTITFFNKYSTAHFNIYGTCFIHLPHKSRDDRGVVQFYE